VEDADVRSIIEGDWKLIQPSDQPSVNQNTNTELSNDAEPQLYNLASDPGEKSNVASQYPERVKKLTELLDKVRAEGRSR
jgi:arylsulfatase A